MRNQVNSTHRRKILAYGRAKFEVTIAVLVGEMWDFVFMFCRIAEMRTSLRVRYVLQGNRSLQSSVSSLEN